MRICVAIGAALLACSASAVEPSSHVRWDRHSLILDGERTFVWGGEMHPFRLPSPSLWRDVLQKMKAHGYNTVAFYFDWGYHSPKRGVYDFSGIRDMDLLLTIAHETGLYVIARPGPYMNAEVTRGGFPSWLVNQTARARTDAPEYLEAADEWLTHINAILKRHQFGQGGSVIAYQIENELDLTTASHQRYMQHLYDKVRADGIVVPIFHNDKGRNGIWVPTSSEVPGTVRGPVDLYAFDGYPGGSCNADAKPGLPSAAPDWGFYGAGGARGGASASPHTPGFAAEFGGGWFDYWGSNDTYPCTAIRNGPGYQRVFYGTNIANGLTIQSFYMTFGGTSWGWLPAPVVFTSYDYGAAFDEARRPRDKAATMKQLGQFVQTVTPLPRMEKVELLKPAANIKVYHNADPESGTQLYVAMHDPSNATSSDSFAFDVQTRDGKYRVPQRGSLRITGQDAKLLLASYALERQKLVYSTSELQTHLRSGDQDIALLYGREGEDGETVLHFSQAPKVDVLAGEVTSEYSAASGDLRLNYTHRGLARVRISNGGTSPLLLLIGSEQAAQEFWRYDTQASGVLVRGPALVRGAVLEGATLQLRGDTTRDSELEFWATNVTRVQWNDREVPTRLVGPHQRVATTLLPGPQRYALPDLMQSQWVVRAESPEASLDFDDRMWRVADVRRSAGSIKPPQGQPVLAMDDYGFHHGDVWYRGRFRASGEDRVTLHYGAGGAGLLQLWIDGTFIGENELATGLVRPLTTGVATFKVPPLSADREHQIAVMVRNNSHNWDLDGDDAHKETRGLISVSIEAPTGKTFAVPIAWKIQGNRGGEDIVDRVRGVMNSGGLFGEREGWHLPGFVARDWQATRLPQARVQPGTTWYRTAFDLAVPRGHDASLAITFGDPNTPRSPVRYRVLMFVNGWNMGQFIAHVGPQRTFVVPSGIIDPNGRNTLALAVTSDGEPGNALERVQLIDLATVRGGVPLQRVAAPNSFEGE